LVNFQNPQRRYSPGVLIAIVVAVGLLVLVAVTAITRSNVVVAGTAVVSDEKPSDEDQIRGIVRAFEDAWNGGSFDAFRPILCSEMRADEEFNEEQFRDARNDGGQLNLILESVDFTGDYATADVSNGGRNNQDIDFVREGGEWKWCTA
jgi:hypothetical protein